MGNQLPEGTAWIPRAGGPGMELPVDSAGTGTPAAPAVLRAALDVLSAGIAILDEGGRIVQVNQRWLELGRAMDLPWPDGGLGQDYLQVVAAAWRPARRVLTELAQLLEGMLAGPRTNASFELAWGPEGREHWVLVRLGRFTSGEAVWLMSSHEDISSRKSIELQREQLFQTCRKRFQELQCVYKVASIFQRADAAIQQRMLEVLDALHESVDEPINAALHYQSLDGEELLLGSCMTGPPQLFYPVHLEGRAVGALEIAFHPAGMVTREFTLEERNLFQVVAQQLGFHLERSHNEALQLHLARSNSDFKGETFFRELVQTMARLLHADVALVAEFVPDSLTAHTIACWLDGAWQPPMTCMLPGTPCERVLQSDFGLFDRAVQQQFPQDARLRELNIESYAGISLRSADGRRLGLLAVMHRSPLHNPAPVQARLQILAARAASELERRQAEEALLGSEARLRSQSSELELHKLRLEELVEARTVELRRAKDSAESANHAKSELLRIVAHDLRNPLLAISLTTELLEPSIHRGAPATEVAARVASMREKVRQMEKLIGNVLAADRLESGHLTLQIEPLDARSTLAEVLKAYQVQAESKHIELFSASPDQPLLWYADRMAVREVLDNLVSNALKYSPPGAEVWCRLLRQDEWVQFQVEDRGPGLTDSDRQRLFQSFARLSAQPTGGETSTGLGLSIAKQMVAGMGGRIWAESPGPQQGSTFAFVLPGAPSGR